VLPLRGPRASYATPSGFQRLADEVGPHVGPNEKALVFYDGFVVDPRICGVSEMAPRNGGGYGVSVISLQSDCWMDLGQGARTARIAAHELLHNLGAVPSKAPSRCGDSSLGGHVCDSTRDVMFPYASGAMSLPDAILDVGRNDYYGHSGEWWDVQDSAWLAHLPLQTVGVAVAGPGSVASAPPVLTCPGACTATLESDSSVRLTASPDPGAEFYGWRGGCSGETDCRLTVTGPVSIEATFGAPRPTLVVQLRGKGRVTSIPPGVSCPGRCSAKYPTGKVVTLRARPSAGWAFRAWSGACGRKAGCTLRIATDRTVTGTFVRASTRR
jgi:hypothetical protein